MPPKRVAWIGTGRLGYAMAEHLLGSGWHLVAWNRSRQKALPLAEHGAVLADTPEEAVASAALVGLVLDDVHAIETVLDRTSAHLEKRTLVQMGTIGPEESIRVAQRVQEAGARYLEAPVLGSVPEARSGTLFVMAGGDAADFESCKELLGTLGREPCHVGGVGQAAALKLAFNQLIAGLTTSFAYSLGLVRRHGLDVDLFMRMLRQSALYAPTFDKKLPKMLERDFGTANFSAKHLAKDIALVLREGQNIGLDTSMVDALHDILERTVRTHANSDYSALYEVVDPE